MVLKAGPSPVSPIGTATIEIRFGYVDKHARAQSWQPAQRETSRYLPLYAAGYGTPLSIGADTDKSKTQTGEGRRCPHAALHCMPFGRGCRT